jgi:hypothetical protein
MMLRSTKNNFTSHLSEEHSKESDLVKEIDIRNNPQMYEEMYKNNIEICNPEDSLMENILLKERFKKIKMRGDQTSSKKSNNQNNYTSNKTIFKAMTNNSQVRKQGDSKKDWRVDQHPMYSYVNMAKISSNLNYFYGSFQKFESPKFTFPGMNNASIHREADRMRLGADTFSLRGNMASPEAIQEIQKNHNRLSFFGNKNSQRNEVKRKIHLIDK